MKYRRIRGLGWCAVSINKPDDYEEDKISFDDLQRMSFSNSPDLPHKIKYFDGVGFVYFEWLGFGWGSIDPCENAVLVIS